MNCKMLYIILKIVAANVHTMYNNNNNDFFCPIILEDQAPWRDKIKGLSKLVIENNA